jgi:hypothetical protein
MSKARIVCTVFEDALRLAARLSLSFEVVEIIEPGVACEPADLEINLEWCSLDEAQASLSLLLEAGDAIHNQRPWSLAKGREMKAGARRASDLAHGANFLREDDTTVSCKAQSANCAGSDIAAAGQHRKAASATNPPAALIKAPGRGSRLIDWLHRFCPVTRSQLLP